MKRRNFLKSTSLTIVSMSLTRHGYGAVLVEPGWQVLSDLPYPVQEIYPALHKGCIYVAGGLASINGKTAATERHVRYSIADDRWTELAPLPEARHHLQLVTVNDAIYALGGFRQEGNNGWIMTGQSWRYEIASDSWSLLTEALEVHGESVSLLVDDTIHVIGGRTPKAERNTGWFDHRSSDRHLILDTSAGHWFQAAPAPTARNSAAGGVLNGDLYVAGGRSDTGVNLDTLEVYDVKEERWRTATPMPQAQGGLAATVIDNQLMVFGGEHFGADGVRVYAEAWRYEPSKDRWFTEQPMLTPRHGLGAVAYGGCAYAIGGATGIATNGTSAKLEAIQLNFN